MSAPGTAGSRSGSAAATGFDVVSAGERESREEQLRELVRSGRLPISQRNVEVIVPEDGADRRQIINEWSRDADLTLVAIRREAARRLGVEAFDGYDEVGNIAFVIGVSDVEIERDEQVEAPPGAPHETLRADADEIASEDHPPKPATRSAGA